MKRESKWRKTDRVPTGRRIRWSQLAEKARHEPESEGRGVMKLETLCVMQRNADGTTRCWVGERARGEKTVSRH